MNKQQKKQIEEKFDKKFPIMLEPAFKGELKDKWKAQKKEREKIKSFLFSTIENLSH